MSEPFSTWDDLLTGLRDGSNEAYQRFWEQYGPVLRRVADRQLSERIQRRVGADDVVQSACRTFFRRITDGQFDLPDPDSLWRLMCTLTVTKAKRVARDQMRQKRNAARETHVDETEIGAAQLADPRGSAVSEVELADQLESLVNGLGEVERKVLEMRLEGLDTADIATRLDYSERSVRRITASIRASWEDMLA